MSSEEASTAEGQLTYEGSSRPESVAGASVPQDLEIRRLRGLRWAF